MLKTTKWAIVRAIYSIGTLTENSEILAVVQTDPVEWGYFEEALFFDCEKTAMLLSQELSDCYDDYKTSVVAVSFVDTTEE